MTLKSINIYVIDDFYLYKSIIHLKSVKLNVQRTAKNNDTM